MRGGGGGKVFSKRYHGFVCGHAEIGRFQFSIDIVRVVQLTERWCCFAGNLFLEDKNICSFVKVDDTLLKYQTTLSAVCLFVCFLFVCSLYGSCFPFFS